MKIRPTTTDIGYGCRVAQRVTHYKNKTVLYRKDYLDKKLCSLLVYTMDNVGRWLKSELRIFKDNKCIKTIKSKNDRMV